MQGVGAGSFPGKNSVEVQHKICQCHALLEKAGRRAPDISALHRLALCQQRAAGKQLFLGGDGALDGTIINKHIGILDPGVKILQRDIHGGKAVAAVGKGRKNVFATGHADHLRHIVSAFAHSGKAAGSNGEKRAAFAGGGLLQQRCNALRLLRKNLLGKGFFAQQDTVQFDPFHPCQRAALVAGALHQHRNAEPFQLLLYLRGVVDHGIFHRKAAFCGQDAFVVRGAVLACVGDAPGLHGLLCLVQIPALGAGAGKGNAVQRVQMEEQVHGRGGHQIDVLHRLL